MSSEIKTVITLAVCVCDPTIVSRGAAWFFTGWVAICAISGPATFRF